MVEEQKREKILKFRITVGWSAVAVKKDKLMREKNAK